mmetsp:Transcript_122483/g.342815  ORF Transcript_122483/g.342815 Transcript_122483/m.342815 type:complete len:319 (-) Transcript_122483:949-1905(-)
MDHDRWVEIFNETIGCTALGYFCKTCKKPISRGNNIRRHLKLKHADLLMKEPSAKAHSNMINYIWKHREKDSRRFVIPGHMMGWKCSICSLILVNRNSHGSRHFKTTCPDGKWIPIRFFNTSCYRRCMIEGRELQATSLSTCALINRATALAPSVVTLPPASENDELHQIAELHKEVAFLQELLASKKKVLEELSRNAGASEEDMIGEQSVTSVTTIKRQTSLSMVDDFSRILGDHEGNFPVARPPDISEGSSPQPAPNHGGAVRFQELERPPFEISLADRVPLKRDCFDFYTMPSERLTMLLRAIEIAEHRKEGCKL